MLVSHGTRIHHFESLDGERGFGIACPKGMEGADFLNELCRHLGQLYLRIHVQCWEGGGAAGPFRDNGLKPVSKLVQTRFL